MKINTDKVPDLLNPFGEKPVKTHHKKNKSPITSLVILLAGITVGATGFFWIQQTSLQQIQQTLTQSIQKKKQTIQSKTGGQDSDIYINLTQSLAHIESNRVQWSEVVYEILNIEEKNNLVFLSFSATPEQKISVRGKSPSIENIQTLLTRLKNQEKTKNPFVSSLAEIKEQNGTISYQFELTFDMTSSPS